MKTTLTRCFLAIPMVALLFGCPDEPTLLPIQFVAVSNVDGSEQATITEAQCQAWVDHANEVFEPHHYRFTFNYSELEQWRSLVLNDVPEDPPEGWSEEEDGIWYPPWLYDLFGNSLGTTHFPDKIVVIIRFHGGGGWSWGPWSLQYVSMPMYTHTGIGRPVPGVSNPNNTLLAHELGHYLGLAHTFNSYFNSAARAAGTDGDAHYPEGITPTNADGDANGQLGDKTEDDIPDTPGDLPGFLAPLPPTSMTCPGGPIVTNGHTFDVPWTNAMSYHDCLPERITLYQRAAVNYALSHPNRSAIPIKP